MINNLLKATKLVASGEFLRVWREVHLRLYRAWCHLPWVFYLGYHGRATVPGSITIKTKVQVALDSPDHLAPKGTVNDNSRNLGFVMAMDRLMRREFRLWSPGMIDLGCAGGQTVIDFKNLGWQAAGIDGSDRSLRMGRANWLWDGGRNLFCADITKPFQLMVSHYTLNWPMAAHLITAWEVLEHIREEDLPGVFQNIVKHLVPGGYFIASTTETSDVHRGFELHQTRWTNAQWKAAIKANCTRLEPVNLHLKPYQMVRQNFLHPSFLTYRKKL